MAFETRVLIIKPGVKAKDLTDEQKADGVKPGESQYLEVEPVDAREHEQHGFRRATDAEVAEYRATHGAVVTTESDPIQPTQPGVITPNSNAMPGDVAAGIVGPGTTTTNTKAAEDIKASKTENAQDGDKTAPAKK